MKIIILMKYYNLYNTLRNAWDSYFIRTYIVRDHRYWLSTY